MPRSGTEYGALTDLPDWSYIGMLVHCCCYIMIKSSAFLTPAWAYTLPRWEANSNLKKTTHSRTKTESYQGKLFG